jgi:acylphosphatase
MSVARRFIVKGRVQGVFFRESTRREAETLGLSGHAINLSNGDVEVLACGADEAVDRLAHWLESGPPLAKVNEISAEPADPPESDGFRTG